MFTNPFENTWTSIEQTIETSKIENSMVKIKVSDLKVGMKFKSKAEYYNGCTFKVLAIEESKVILKLTDANKVSITLQPINLDTFVFDVNFGCYEIINTRPEIQKNNQLEDCGAYAD